MQNCVAVEECCTVLKEAIVSLQDKFASNATDQNILQGVLTFADRVKKMPKSKLTTSFHCFGAEWVYNTRLTETSIVKKRKGGTIAVQPEAVKRRKVRNGSRRKQNKGQTANVHIGLQKMCKEMSMLQKKLGEAWLQKQGYTNINHTVLYLHLGAFVQGFNFRENFHEMKKYILDIY
jgi:hypothetical protein